MIFYSPILPLQKHQGWGDLWKMGSISDLKRENYDLLRMGGGGYKVNKVLPFGKPIF